MENCINLKKLKNNLKEGYTKILTSLDSKAQDTKNYELEDFDADEEFSYDNNEEICPHCGDTLEWEYDDDIDDDVLTCFTCNYIKD